jgi:hypothetical protein
MCQRPEHCRRHLHECEFFPAEHPLYISMTFVTTRLVLGLTSSPLSLPNLVLSLLSLPLSLTLLGSLNAGLAQWLIRTQQAPSTYRVSQGSRVGREGTIIVTAAADGKIWVGGHATICITGSVTI